MEQKITEELIEQAKKAESAEALLALAKENGVALTREDAQRYYDMWHTTAELSDEELENVAGGGCWTMLVPPKRGCCPNCYTGYDIPDIKGTWNYRCECGTLLSHLDRQLVAVY